MIFKTNSKVNKHHDMEKIPMKFDISMLNMLIGFLFKTSVQINRRSLSNLSRLINMIDESIYDGNEQMSARFEFIKKALEARLEKGFESYEMIIQYCRTDIENEINNEIIDNIVIYSKLNYEEIKHINKAVEDRLKFAYIHFYKDRMYNVLEKMESGNFKSYYEINTQMLDLCTKYMNQARQANSVESTDTFSLDDENFDNNILDMVTQLKNPSRQLYTGIRALNEMLCPAIMSGRLYMFMGLPAGFKSGILLKITRDIRKYNKGIQGKKPGKRPCVLLVTMENSLVETVERLFNMTVSNSNIRNYTPKQVLKMIKESGEFTIKDTDELDIDIVIKYYPNRAIDTADLYTIVEDLSDTGKEVIALVLDYIKRIRPAERGKDEKEELKNVTNELKSLALTLDIPVVSATQLNRSGAATIDAAMQSNKEDLARFLGRSNTGSALTSGALKTFLIAGTPLELIITKL